MCFLDALDECQESDRKQLIEVVTTAYQGSNRGQKLKFFVTSRPYEHIRRQLNRRLGSQMSSIHLQGDYGRTTSEISEETKLVVECRIKEIAFELDLRPDECQFMRQHIDSVLNRTYLWVTLVFDGLMDSKLCISKGDILDLTSKPPQSVDDASEKILNRSPDRERQNARRALCIILGAKRPPSLSEMSVALAFKDGQQSSDRIENNIFRKDQIGGYLRDLCGLFVTIVDDKVYLLHSTAREFLICSQIGITPESMAIEIPSSLHEQQEDAMKYKWKHSIR